jgi:protein involved in polysaccharide export with SLBB domain
MVRLAVVVALSLLSPSVPVYAQSQAPAESRQAQFVFITGAVEKPGKYALTEGMTLIQLVAASGGMKQSADRRRMLLVSGTKEDAKGNPTIQFVDFTELAKGRDLGANNPKLQPGDTLLVRDRN